MKGAIIKNTLLLSVITIVVISGFGIYSFTNASVFDQLNASNSKMSESGIQENPSNQALSDSMEEKKAIMRDTNSAEVIDSEMIDDTMMLENATGTYREYTPTHFQATTKTQRVLFFYANWCPTCAPVDESLRTNTERIPKNTTVLRVNYNDTDTSAEEKALAQEYDVTYQHTFVQLDEKGEVTQRWNGGDLDTLIRKLE